jgi:putative NADH-flavin reductase
MSSQQPFVLIGATGPTGLQILAAAQQQGLPVRALVRNPDRLSPQQRAGAEVVQGDVLDPNSLRQALSGTCGVISTLGTALTLRPVHLLSEGTRHLVEAMQATGVERLLCVTGMGAGDSRGHGGWLYDRVILPLLLGRIYADKDRQESVVRGSSLDWVLVRPAFLTDGPAQGRYRRIGRFSPGDRMTRIARADVARFLVGELQSPTLHRETVNLSD